MSVSKTLKEEIGNLEELRKRLQRVRQIPPVLLQGTSAGDEFGAVKEVGELAGSEEVQRALNRARESLEVDGSGLGTEHRRRKRSRARSPEGYVEEQRRGTSFLPSCREEGVKMEGMGEWARVYNSTHKNKIRIRGRMVRFSIPDVMTVYMGIGTGDGNRVVVETIRAFGPREQVEGHGQSRYTVYRELSQQLIKMLEEEQVRFQTVVQLLESYSDVFVSTCSACGRVVAGHVPALVRSWTGSSWRTEHIGCAIGGALG